MERVEKLAYERNASAIGLASGFQRTDAHGFYEHLGYKKTSFWFRRNIPAREPDVRTRMAEGSREDREEGIRNTVELLREFGHADPEIRRAIIRKYDLTSEKAQAYL